MSNDNFELSESLNDELATRFGNYTPETIASLKRESIDDILNGYIPEFFYVFSNTSDKKIKLLNSLGKDDLVSTNSLIYDLPKLFTDIEQVAFIGDGLVVLSSYMNQIYYLYKSDGTFLLGPCHDLELGAKGKILSRNSSDLIWEYHSFDGSLLKIEKQSGELIPENHFPFISNRDSIPQMHYTLDEYLERYPPLHPINNNEVEVMLKENPNAWRVLTKFYQCDINLAKLAVNSNSLAFTFLSTSLQNNRSFVLNFLSEKEKLCDLYRFLPSDLKKDKEIIMLIYKECPSALLNLELIENKDILRYVFKTELNNSPEKYLKIATPTILNDKSFLLELAPYSSELLNFINPVLLKDTRFVQRVKNLYELAEIERNRQLWG
jgi:hypothetical protein